YQDILSRNLLLQSVLRASRYTAGGLSLSEVARTLTQLVREKQVFPPSMGELDLRRRVWTWIYREFLTDEPRISLEGVGLVRWFFTWPPWLSAPEVLLRPPWSLTE